MWNRIGSKLSGPNITGTALPLTMLSKMMANSKYHDNHMHLYPKISTLHK